MQLFLADFYIWQTHYYADPNFHGGIAVSALDRNDLPFVDVPAIESPLTVNEHEQLERQIDPLLFVNPISAFRETTSFVNHCLIEIVH